MKPKYATLNKFHDQLVTVMLLEWCPENLPRNLPPDEFPPIFEVPN